MASDAMDTSRLTSSSSMIKNALRVSPSSCLEFYLGDNFGEGWGGAKLYVYDEDGHFHSYAPNKTTNDLHVKYCYNSKINLLTVHILGSPMELKYELLTNVTLTAVIKYFRPPSALSLTWKARNLRNGDVYIGNHLTKMVFRYQNESISLGYAQSLASSPLRPNHCKSCNLGRSLTFLDYVQKLSSQSTITQESSEVATPVTNVVPDYVEEIDESVTGSMKLYGRNDTWFYPNGFGTSYEIISIDGSKTFYAGTLCGGHEITGGSPCSIDLQEGNYLWRVGGALDTNRASVAWDFCDAHGSAMTELLFEIDASGRCYPVATRYAFEAKSYPMSAAANASSPPASDEPLQLQGVVDFIGLNSAELSDMEISLLEATLSHEFEDAKSVATVEHSRVASMSVASTHVQILSWQNIASSPKAFSRASMQANRHDSQSPFSQITCTDRITFQVMVKASDFSMDISHSEVAVEKFLSYMRRYLQVSLDSGVFKSRFQSAYKENDLDLSTDVTRLQSITKITFVELTSVEIIPSETLPATITTETATKRPRVQLEYLNPQRKAGTSTGEYGGESYLGSADMIVLIAIVVGAIVGLSIGYFRGISTMKVATPITCHGGKVTYIFEKDVINGCSKSD